MPSLNRVLLNKEKCYLYQKHYKYFTIEKVNIDEKNVSKKELYLTYNGILKVLFTSRSGIADKF